MLNFSMIREMYSQIVGGLTCRNEVYHIYCKDNTGRNLSGWSESTTGGIQSVPKASPSKIVVDVQYRHSYVRVN